MNNKELKKELEVLRLMQQNETCIEYSKEAKEKIRLILELKEEKKDS